MTCTQNDLDSVKCDFGYVGHLDRNIASDSYLLQVFNRFNLSPSDLALWAGSSYGRHFMDSTYPRLTNFTCGYVIISRHLSTLKSEV